MALRVLDGNQTATTLSSVVTGGEHIVAHSVVSLGANAIANITSAVSGSVVSVSNFPASQSTTFGAVTGSVSVINTPAVTVPRLENIVASVATEGAADASISFVKIGGHQDGSNQIAHIVHVSAGGAMKVDASGSSVTFSQAPVTFGAVTGSVSILNFPATQTIAGTVTANVFGANQVGSLLRIPVAEAGDPQAETGVPIAANIGGGPQVVGDSYPLPISGTVTANAWGVNYSNGLAPAQLPIREDFDAQPFVVVGPSTTPEPFNVSGTVTANVISIPNVLLTGSNGDPINDGGAIPVFLGQAGEVYGTVTVGNSVTIGSFSTSVTARLINPAGTAVTYAEVGTAGNPSIDVLSVQGVSGGTSIPVSISSVTIGSLPSGALTTRFGSVTTANTAQISSAVTNASRKYLLIQNVTTSSNVITVGVGFTPTTTQGIQLSAGGGITFESSYIPTGAVYILSSVTASPFTILEA